MDKVDKDEATLLLDCGIDIHATNKVVECSQYPYLNTHNISKMMFNRTKKTH